MPQGRTKGAWVKRKYGYQAKHNILSGNANHTFWIPQSQEQGYLQGIKVYTA